jgi:hypothetical protein
VLAAALLAATDASSRGGIVDDRHFKGKDFFNVAEAPTATFIGDRYVSDGDRYADAAGPASRGGARGMKRRASAYTAASVAAALAARLMHRKRSCNSPMQAGKYPLAGRNCWRDSWQLSAAPRWRGAPGPETHSRR